MNRNPAFAGVPNEEMRGSSLRTVGDAHAFRSEHQSLYDLTQLIQHSLETISFILLILDHGIARHFQTYPLPP